MIYMFAVMRLTKPSLLTSFPLDGESHELKPGLLGQCTNGLESFSTGMFF